MSFFFVAAHLDADGAVWHGGSVRKVWLFACKIKALASFFRQVEQMTWSKSQRGPGRDLSGGSHTTVTQETCGCVPLDTNVWCLNLTKETSPQDVWGVSLLGGGFWCWPVVPGGCQGCMPKCWYVKIRIMKEKIVPLTDNSGQPWPNHAIHKWKRIPVQPLHSQLPTSC